MYLKYQPSRNTKKKKKSIMELQVSIKIKQQCVIWMSMSFGGFIIFFFFFGAE